MPQGIRVNIRGFKIDTLNELERVSDINMVNYYKDELDKLDRGLNFDIHYSGKKRLYKRNIIYYKPFNPSIQRQRIYLTPKGKEILNSLK